MLIQLKTDTIVNNQLLRQDVPASPLFAPPYACSTHLPGGWGYEETQIDRETLRTSPLSKKIWVFLRLGIPIYLVAQLVKESWDCEIGLNYAKFWGSLLQVLLLNPGVTEGTSKRDQRDWSLCNSVISSRPQSHRAFSPVKTRIIHPFTMH